MEVPWYLLPTSRRARARHAVGATAATSAKVGPRPLWAVVMMMMAVVSNVGNQRGPSALRYQGSQVRV